MPITHAQARSFVAALLATEDYGENATRWLNPVALYSLKIFLPNYNVWSGQWYQPGFVDPSVEQARAELGKFFIELGQALCTPERLGTNG